MGDDDNGGSGAPGVGTSGGGLPLPGPSAGSGGPPIPSSGGVSDVGAPGGLPVPGGLGGVFNPGESGILGGVAGALDPRARIINQLGDELLGDLEEGIRERNIRRRVEECNGECDENDPCRHLEWGSGKGEFRGGSYRAMRKLSPNGNIVPAHHMPAHQVSPWASPRDGTQWQYDRTPAIMMRVEDHRLTASNGSSTEAKIYRAQQADYIARQETTAAIMMDFDDLKAIAQSKGRGSDYQQALDDALAYARCL